jgi:hypothetical protein
VSGRLKKANSTACSAQFLEESIHCLEKSEQIISGELQAANGYHGLDHPAVAIDVPELECECKDSFSIEAMEKSMEASACREGGEVYWILSVRGLVAGFVYEIRFEWFVLKGKQNTHLWSHTIFSSSTSSYTVRQPISQMPRDVSTHTSVWDAFISKQDPSEIEVTVRDMHPALTSEDALIGARRMNPAVNTVRLTCAKLPATIPDKGFEHSIRQNEEHENDGGKADLRNGAQKNRGLTGRAARCERVGGGVGKAVSVPGSHTPIYLASSYYYMCPHYYWRRLQMSCAVSPAAALIPTDKINSVVPTD